MTVRRIPLPPRHREIRELRIARTGGVVFVAIHDFDKCVSGPIGVPEEALTAVARALADVAAEIAAAADKEPAQ